MSISFSCRHCMISCLKFLPVFIDRVLIWGLSFLQAQLSVTGCPGDWQSAEARPYRPQWRRAQEQLSTKEVVRRSSRGRPVERRWPKAQFCSWQGRGCGGWLPSDPEEPADGAWGRGAGSESHWNRTKTAAGQRRHSARWEIQNNQRPTNNTFHVDYFLLFFTFYVNVELLRMILV